MGNTVPVVGMNSVYEGGSDPAPKKMAAILLGPWRAWTWAGAGAGAGDAWAVRVVRRWGAAEVGKVFMVDEMLGCVMN